MINNREQDSNDICSAVLLRRFSAIPSNAPDNHCHVDHTSIITIAVAIEVFKVMMMMMMNSFASGFELNLEYGSTKADNCCIY